jgi:benzoylformate decarboxylase
MPDERPPETRRWARDYVFDILRQLEIHYIFGVPGTNEIPIIDGCSIPGNQVTYIECLHENIAMGAAMGYARMTGKPGVLVVHVTPGIGHSLGNLFNAWKSRVPLVVFCGQQQNELVTQEPLLASNLVQVASQYTKWSHELRAWEEIPLVLQRAFKEAMASPCGPVFISFPWEFMIHEIGPEDKVRGVTRIPPHFLGDPSAVVQSAVLLAQAKNPMIVVGDGVGYAQAWPEIQELAERLGAPVYLEGFSSMANFPNGDYHWQGELPGDQKQTQQRFKHHDVAFLCGFGAQAQLAVFKYNEGLLIPAHVRQIYLHNNAWEIGKNDYGEAAILGDIKATLPALNAHLAEHPSAGAKERNAVLEKLAAKRWEQWQAYLEQARQAEKIWGVLVAASLRELIEEFHLEKKFVYVHEAVSDGTAFQMMLPFGPATAEPTSYYCVEGGSLGWSMPASLGIKLAPDGSQGIEAELVVNAVGDGSALFYPQVWWTAKHRDLPILYIIMNNQEYRTLQVGLQQVVDAYGKAPGYNWHPVTMTPDYLLIERPKIDFVDLARTFGVTSGRIVEKPADVKEALRQGIEHVRTTKESFVIDMRTDHTTPPPPAGPQPRMAKSLARFIQQPPVDIYYHEVEATEESAAERTSIPSIF